MGEPALRDDVITALTKAPNLAISVMPDGTVEVSSVGEPIRRFPFRATVSRGLLWDLQRWYGVPIAAFFPSTSVKPQTNAAGE